MPTWKLRTESHTFCAIGYRSAKLSALPRDGPTVVAVMGVSEQHAQVAVAALGYPAQDALVAGRVFARCESQEARSSGRVSALRAELRRST